jgi:hypothetical protein
MAGGYRKPWKWECPGRTVQEGGCRRPVMLEFLEGLGIARRIARGSRRPGRLECPVYPQGWPEDKVGQGGASALDGLWITGRKAGGYRWPMEWEYPGGAMYSREDVRVLVVWSALEGQCIAESITGGYRRPGRL